MQDIQNVGRRFVERLAGKLKRRHAKSLKTRADLVRILRKHYPADYKRLGERNVRLLISELRSRDIPIGGKRWISKGKS